MFLYEYRCASEKCDVEFVYVIAKDATESYQKLDSKFKGNYWCMLTGKVSKLSKDWEV